MHERRDNDRKQLTDYFIVFDRATGRMVGRMIDLSLTGAMIISEDPIQTPTTFACRMDFPEEVQGYHQVTFDLESKWCERNDAIGMYETGHQFVGLIDENRQLVKIILEKWTSEKHVPKQPDTQPLRSDY